MLPAPASTATAVNRENPIITIQASNAGVLGLVLTEELVKLIYLYLYELIPSRPTRKVSI